MRAASGRLGGRQFGIIACHPPLSRKWPRGRPADAPLGYDRRVRHLSISHVALLRFAGFITYACVGVPLIQRDWMSSALSEGSNPVHVARALHAQNHTDILLWALSYAVFGVAYWLPALYLNAAPETLWQRLRNSRHRPMLQAADPRNRLVELYKLRDPLYREVATHVIESDRDAVIRFVRWLDQEPCAEC